MTFIVHQSSKVVYFAVCCSWWAYTYDLCANIVIFSRSKTSGTIAFKLNAWLAICHCVTWSLYDAIDKWWSRESNIRKRPYPWSSFITDTHGAKNWKKNSLSTFSVSNCVDITATHVWFVMFYMVSLQSTKMGRQDDRQLTTTARWNRLKRNSYSVLTCYATSITLWNGDRQAYLHRFSTITGGPLTGEFKWLGLL